MIRVLLVDDHPIVREGLSSLLATVDDVPVGCVVLDVAPDALVLRRFGVVPSAQGTGVATALVRAAVELAAGRSAVRVLAREELPETVSFWERHDFVETFKLIRTHHGLRFVFLMVVVLGALAGSIYNLLSSATLAVLDAGTKGIGFLGGILAGGMILGSLLVGTVGARWDKRWMMVVGCLLMGVLMVLGSVWFSYAIFMPIAFIGGAVLAPVMVSMDTLLHEWTPRQSRGLVFSTRDTVLGGSFVVVNVVAGFLVAALQAVARTPYAVGLFVFGVVVVVGTLGAASTQLGFGRKPPAT